MNAKVKLTKRGRFVGHLFAVIVSVILVFSIPFDWYPPGTTAIFILTVVTSFTIIYNVEMRYPPSPLFIREDEVDYAEAVCCDCLAPVSKREAASYLCSSCHQDWLKFLNDTPA